MHWFPQAMSMICVAIASIAWIVAVFSGVNYFLNRGRWMTPEANMALMGVSGAVAFLFGFMAVAVAVVAAAH